MDISMHIMHIIRIAAFRIVGSPLRKFGCIIAAAGPDVKLFLIKY